MYTSDVEDAFQLVCIIAGVEDNPSDQEFNKLRNKWKKALAQSKEELIDLLLATTIRRSFHGRVVLKKHLNNPIFVGRTKTNALIALDGGHRLKQHIENQNEFIPAIIVDISWLDDADDMDFNYNKDKS
jgi:hypothetical protein